MANPPDPAATTWHIDKRLPVALLVGLFIHAGGFGYWAAMTTGDVTGNKEAISRVEDQVRQLGRELVAQGNADTSMIRQLEATNSSLSLLRQDVREMNSLLRSLLAGTAGGGVRERN